MWFMHLSGGKTLLHVILSHHKNSTAWLSWSLSTSIYRCMVLIWWESFPCCMKSFLIHFHWKRTSFFAILEWNSKWTTGSNQMISSNTVSVGTLIEEIKSEWIRENQPPSECAIVCYLTVYFHSGCPRRVYGWPLKLILKHLQNRNRSSLSIHWHPMRFLVIVPNLCPLFQRFQIRDCRLRGYFDW